VTTSSTSQNAQARSGLLLIMGAAMLWGTAGISTKLMYGFTAVTPLSVSFFRLALAAPVLWLVGWRAVGQRMLQAPARDWGLMVLMGLMTAVYQICFFSALQILGVAIASLITLCSAPALVALLSAVVLKERPSLKVLIALVSALVGTALLIQVQPNSPTNGPVLLGVVWSLASASGYAVVALVSRDLANRYHPVQPIAVGFTVGALALLCLAFGGGLVLEYPPLGWVLLIYMGVIPTALAYTMFILGMRSTPATIASIGTLLEPLTSTILAALIFHETLSLLGLVGAVLLCSALLILWRR
jgi:drug/metabolite transporter, DME family